MDTGNFGGTHQGEGNFPAPAGTRRYRSKSQRPCDLCRARKALCNIPSPGKPCQLCTRLGRQCTFVRNPNKRQKEGQNGAPQPRNSVPGFVDLAVNDDKDIDSSPSVIEDMTEDATAPAEMPLQDQYLDMSTSIDENNRLTGLSPEMNLPHLDSVLADSLWPTGREDSWSMQPVPTSLQGAFPSLSEEDGFRELGIFDTTLNHKEQTPVAGPPQPSSRAHHASSPHVSIDDQADYSAQMIGFSNESDPFFLQHFPYNDVGELKFFRVVYRKPDILSSGIPNESSHSTPVHLLQSHNQTASLAIELTERCLSQNHDRERVQQLVDSTMGVALVRLYFRFVFESLPVLSRSCILQNESAFVETAPVGLLAAIYALALPFISFDEQFCLNNAYTKPSSDTLWQIAYANLQKELHFPKLATLQLCILLINHYPFDPVSVDTPFVWSMACSMLGIAQTLGLNVDPSAWNLPRWEIRLRRRLWWCVFVDHTWRSVTHGRALMISDDDWNVTHLDSSDFEMDLDSDVGRSPEYFFQLCRLTEIARRVVRQFYSLRAVSQPQSLERLIEQAREPRQQLLEWMNGLPQSLQMHMDGHAEDDYEGEDEDALSKLKALCMLRSSPCRFWFFELSYVPSWRDATSLPTRNLQRLRLRQFSKHAAASCKLSSSSCDG